MSKNRRMIVTPVGRLAVYQTGQGPVTLLLWPSIFTDHHIFDALVNSMAWRCRVITVDGPGHGASEGAAREFSMADCGKAMGAILDALDVDAAVVGGVSWGGIAAAEFAIEAPDRVLGLVMMNTPMHLDKDNVPLSSRMITLGARWMPAASAFRNGVAKSFFDPKALRDSPVYEQAFHAMLRTADGKALSRSVRSVLLNATPLVKKLHHIDAPTLVIAGREDAMYPIALQGRAASRIRNRLFLPVKGRHISVIDAPLDVAAAVDNFLTTISLDTTALEAIA